MFALPPTTDSDSFPDPIRLADWMELNLVAEEEDSVSIESVATELAGPPTDDSDESEQRADQDSDSVRDDSQVRKGYWYEAVRKTEDAFAELSGRAEYFEDCYPFDVTEDSAIADLSKGTFEIYRFLVLLRARQLYPGALGDPGDESGYLFEELVTHSLAGYLGSNPINAIRFGVALGSRGGGLPLPLSDAVVELSRRMSEKEGMIPVSGKDDYRADAIAWRPFGDRSPGQLVMIGQAKITEGSWMDSEPANRWTDRVPEEDCLIRFVARPVTAVGFPETLSLTKREVLIGANFSSIPLDRLRLLSSIRTENLPDDLRERMRDWNQSMKLRLQR